MLFKSTLDNPNNNNKYLKTLINKETATIQQ